MTKVKIRSKLIKGAKESLFLDYYPPILHPDTGKKKRWEYLDLYVHVKAKTDIEKTHNSETWALVENIRAKRQIEVQSNHYEFLSDSKRNSNFIDYFESILKTKNEKNFGVWHCTFTHLKNFTNGSITFGDLSVGFCNDFRRYLLQAYRIHSNKLKICQNTAHVYLVTLKTALKKAYREGYLKTDISLNIDTIKRIEIVRTFLTIEELNVLIRTECSSPCIKKASLFSALTGLRFSDIEKLTWNEVHTDKNEKGKTMYTLHFVQKKTKGAEILPVSEQAYNLLGKRGNLNEKIFKGLKYSSYTNDQLKKWISKAHITKRVSFHAFRRSYATLQLSAGTDLYTVSKLLGHRDISTTQLYVRLVDKAKVEAADRITLDFSPVPALKKLA